VERGGRESLDIAGLERDLGIPRLVGEILARRGFSDVNAVRSFFSPDLKSLHDPFLLPDMKPAAERLWQAVERKERLLVHGDYDVDGVTAVTLLVKFFQMLGVEISHTLPNRLSGGYGLSERAIGEARERGATVLVTVDCGISNHEQVARAAELGIDTIITDHHLPSADLPPALAVVAPSRIDSRYPNRELAGVGVAFKLLQAMKALRPDCPAMPEDGLDLVALGTVADVVPLVGENRILVAFGLEKLARPARPGLRALKSVAGFGSGASVTSGQVAFRLAPRLNAAGRLGTAEVAAERAVDLLLSEKEDEAQSLAEVLDKENTARRELDKQALEKAQSEIESEGLGERRVIVLGMPYGPESPGFHFWHPGVIGIVASRLVREYGVPAILVAFEDGIGRGSGRSIKGFHLADALGECGEWLISSGGHEQAAGLAVRLELFESFRERMEALAAEKITPEMMERTREVDLVVRLSDCTPAVLEAVQDMQPFGVGNPEPVFATMGATMKGNPRTVGGSHLKFTVRQDGQDVEAIAFGMADHAETLYAPSIDVAFTLTRDRWSGERQLNVKDIKPGEGSS
jgi:single-stranded-DNA-specific exonuclease